MAAEGGGGGGGGGGGAGGGGNEIPAMSPKNRVKLLCSHGGKILPRPTDGVLKYVGGETRVVAFSREINFSEVMEKLTSVFEGDLVLKYQLITEDLDALVSVKSDEDLRHMLDEYERQQEGEGSPRLRPFRAFLFPSSTSTLHFTTDYYPSSAAAGAPLSLEQRYIDAINGVLRIPPPPPSLKTLPPKPIFPVSSSACTSPQSPSTDHFSHDPTATATGHESPTPGPGRRVFIHKVRSSPSLCSLNQLAADAHPVGVSPIVYQHHPHHYHQNYQQYHYRHPPPVAQDHYYSPVRQHKGFGGTSNKYVHLEELSTGHGGKRLDNRAAADTLPRVIWE